MKLKPSELSMRPTALLALLCSLFGSAFALADPPENKVVFQNISHNLKFTAPIVAICPEDFAPIAPVGDPASTALKHLAEDGDTSFLEGLFDLGGCSHVTHNALVEPGETIELDLIGKRKDIVFVASMALPTNDAFVAGLEISVKKLTKMGWVGLPAYDAGTELNDENCANIPGPQCGGGGQGFNSDRDDVVNYVHAHGGITGAKDLSPVAYEWGEPVARIRIE